MGDNVHNQVETIRRRRGLSVAELAQRIGVTRQTVYAIESGSYMPNTEVALRVARELEVSVEELFQLADVSGTDGPELISTDYLSATKPEKGQPVRTCRVGARWMSVPVSAVPYHLPEADGLVAATHRNESRPKVHVFSKEPSDSKRLIVAGCDPAASLLAGMVERMGGVEVIHAPASSQLALHWLRDGKVHLAGSHLEDTKTGEFNLPFIHRQFASQDMAVVTFAEWEAGLVVAEENPKKIRRVEDLTRKNIRFVNRETGSGSRALLDKLLRTAALSPNQILGYDHVVVGHLAAAYAVFAQDADCCLATQSAARAFGLHFIPLHRERYDFVLRRQTLDMPQTQAFMDVLQRASLRRKLESLAGYDTSRTGVVID